MQIGTIQTAENKTSDKQLVNKHIMLRCEGISTGTSSNPLQTVNTNNL